MRAASSRSGLERCDDDRIARERQRDRNSRRTLPSIFEMLTQVRLEKTDRYAGGLGIGLELAQGVVWSEWRQHRARPGRAQQNFIFAAHRGGHADRIDEASCPPLSTMVARRVLVADDNRDDGAEPRRDAFDWTE